MIARARSAMLIVETIVWALKTLTVLDASPDFFLVGHKVEHVPTLALQGRLMQEGMFALRVTWDVKNAVALRPPNVQNVLPDTKKIKMAFVFIDAPRLDFGKKCNIVDMMNIYLLSVI